MSYLQELEALQRFVKSTAGINSVRMTSAPPEVARPVILWEAPNRGRENFLDRYKYTTRTTQYGKLYVKDLDSLLAIQESILAGIEDAENTIPVYDTEDQEIGKLRNVVVFFTESENLDIPFRIRYEVTYSKPTPEEAPAATRVVHKLTVDDEGGLTTES